MAAGGEIARIVDQLDRAFSTNAWSGPSVTETIEGVDATMASARPIADAHTIAELVLHIAAWKDIVRRRLEGDPVNPTPAEDWPPVEDASPATWAKIVEKLAASHQALRATVAAFPPERLDPPLGTNRSSPYVLIHGVIQHDLYHAGQIVLLRRAQGNR